jgi:hypothetical protein
LLNAIVIAGPPVSVDACQLEATGASNPRFVWLPADGSILLPGPGQSGASIARIEVLLGDWFVGGQTEVLVTPAKFACPALEYRIDSATMREVADALFPPQ